MFPTGVIDHQRVPPPFSPGQTRATFEFIDNDGHNLTRLLFYPDGTASSAYIVVTDENDQQALLVLDRLTGMVGLEDSSNRLNGREQ